MRNIAIIPARSGSKGLPDKNIKEMCGKPLLAYSVDAAKESGIFDEIMVSTDSEKYAEIAKAYGASVPFLRSEEMSGDTTSSWDVVREILGKYQDISEVYDTVCLLQPTSPLRSSEDIKNAYTLFGEKAANAVIGVCEMDHSPMWSNVIPTDLKMDHFISSQVKNSPRQMLEKYYRINGAIYIVKTVVIEKKIDVFKNAYAYKMPRERSIDIDVELDFIIAESIMRQRKI